MSRSQTVERNTKETRVSVTLELDGEGLAEVNSGVPFFDHLLDAFARHGRFDLTLRCEGDLEVDDHHTVEDCAIVLGQALDRALAERRGLRRFGSAYAPLDEALARAVVDFSGRPFAVVDLGLRRERLGTLSCENIGHAIQSLAFAARACFHVQVLYGENDHHRAEAAFKALALAVRTAVVVEGDRIPSTKEVL